MRGYEGIKQRITQDYLLRHHAASHPLERERMPMPHPSERDRYASLRHHPSQRHLTSVITTCHHRKMITRCFNVTPRLMRRVSL